MASTPAASRACPALSAALLSCCNSDPSQSDDHANDYDAEKIGRVVSRSVGRTHARTGDARFSSKLTTSRFRASRSPSTALDWSSVMIPHSRFDSLATLAATTSTRSSGRVRSAPSPAPPAVRAPSSTAGYRDPATSELKCFRSDLTHSSALSMPESPVPPGRGGSRLVSHGVADRPERHPNVGRAPCQCAWQPRAIARRPLSSVAAFERRSSVCRPRRREGGGGPRNPRGGLRGARGGVRATMRQLFCPTCGSFLLCESNSYDRRRRLSRPGARDRC